MPRKSDPKPKFVMAAIHKFNRVGRQKFLSWTGCRMATSYFVEHDGCFYDSKAIFHGAYRLQYGAASDDIHGGKPTRIALGLPVGKWCKLTARGSDWAVENRYVAEGVRWVELDATDQIENDRYWESVGSWSGRLMPRDEYDAREWIDATISARRGQPAFRKRLIEVYNGTCVISGDRVVEALEAAHILPYNGESTNAIHNGLLLRADLHTLFDLGLVGIDTSVDPWVVWVARSLRNTQQTITGLTARATAHFPKSLRGADRSALRDLLSNHRNRHRL